MTTYNGVLCPELVQQFWNLTATAPAAPVGGANYLLYTYVAGSTTPTTTWTDASLGAIGGPNTNPIVLNSAGQANIFLSPTGVYKFVFTTSNDTNPPTSPIYTVDNIYPPVSSNSVGSLITNTVIGAALYPITPAEVAAAVFPLYYYYPEGDIRRYGASIASTDNSVAINSALSVSSNGGAAAYIPGGNWDTTNPCVAPPGSSMYGAGATNSVIFVATGVDGLQFTTGDGAYGGRIFRDFKILGTLSGTTNNAHGIYATSSGFLLDILFQNVAVINFNWGFFLNNLEDCTIFACLVQNCWQGIYFNNQSVNVFLIANTINLVSPLTVITGTGVSAAVTVTGSPEVEGLHFQSNTLYGYGYGLFLGLIQEVQICANDIANCSVCPIYFTSTLAGITIRDNYLQLGAATTGTWNTTNVGNLTGIFVTAVSPSVNSKVHIHDNDLEIDVVLTGSTGIYLGNGNAGVVCNYNNISSTNNWDIGIGGGNTTTNSGGANNGAHIIGNTISATTTGIAISDLGSDVKIGPNYFPTAPTNPYTFTGGQPAGIDFSQPNAPMQGTVAFVAATTVAVTFTNALPVATYRVALSGNAAGYCWVTSKGTGGFTINCSASNSNLIDWVVSL